MAYRNGLYPPKALAVVQVSAWPHLEPRAILEKVAAARFRAFRAAVKRATRETPVISRYGAYRNLPMQRRLSGKGNHRYAPGGSIHGHGRCVDIWNHGIPEIVDIARRYGFRRTMPEREPWHFEYRPEWDPNNK